MADEIELKNYRQGDVIIREKSPGYYFPRHNKLSTNILKSGEQTGHHHAVTEGDVNIYEHRGTLYLEVLSDTATVTHQEHKPITLPQGNYTVTSQVEYSEDGWRRVAD